MVEEKGANGAKRWCDRIQLEVCDAWVPTGPQPGVGPGGQGEVGLPRKCLHHFQRSPREGASRGAALPSSLPWEDESTST